jgi:hypothetical protein
MTLLNFGPQSPAATVWADKTAVSKTVAVLQSVANRQQNQSESSHRDSEVCAAIHHLKRLGMNIASG